MKGSYYGLWKDLVLFALSTFIPRAVSFLFVPLYTNRLSTYEYGIADMIGTTASLAVLLFTFDINDAVLRYTIENKQDKRPYYIGFQVVFWSLVLVMAVVSANMYFAFVPVPGEYQLFFLIQYGLAAVYGMQVSYLRATDRIVLLAAASMVNTLVSVLCNILLLVIMDWGITGYLTSAGAGMLAANIIIFRKIHIIGLLSEGKSRQRGLAMEMLSYSVPLVSSGIAWWINSASDRYFVMYYLGAGQNGIYSVAYKIPSILQMLQSVFSQAWLISIYQEYGKENGKKFVGRVYDLYHSAMCIACALLILCDIFLAKFLYAKEFYAAWKYVPVLLISVLFIADAGFFESIITLYKKSKVVAATTAAGAVVNAVCNIALIPVTGAMGAAIATAAGYFIMFVLRAVVVFRLYPFTVNWVKYIWMAVLLILEAAAMINTQDYRICIVLAAAVAAPNYRLCRYLAAGLRE